MLDHEGPMYRGPASRLLGAAAVALVLSGGACHARLEATHPTFPLTSYHLENGLLIVLAQDRSSPLVSVNLTFKAGAANQPDGRRGFAHLFEHLMFEGTKHVDAKLQKSLIESIGGTENARTWYDDVELYGTVPSDALEQILWLYSDRMGFMFPGLAADRLEAAKQIVVEERIQRIENSADGMATEAVLEGIFPNPHPYHDLVIGPYDDIQRVTLDEVKRFHDAYLVPANAVLVIVGDIDLDVAGRLAEKYFGSLSNQGPQGSSPHAPFPELPTADATVIDHNAATPGLQFGWATPGATATDAAAVELATIMLGQGPSSLLARRLVDELRLATDVSCVNQVMALASIVICSIELRDATAMHDAEAAVGEVVASLASTPPAGVEVNRAFTLWESALMRDMEPFQKRAFKLAQYAIQMGSPNFLLRDQRRHALVTAVDIQHAARDYLNRRRLVSVEVLPKEKDAVGP